MAQPSQARSEPAKSPTQILMDEHRVIKRMLNVMAKVSHQTFEGWTPDASVVSDASEFISGFADACHHAKEEHRLFPMLEHAGMPADEGPIPVMLAEHERGRAYNRALRCAGERLAGGDESARSDFIDNINGYIALLRLHIKKEDSALFPIADRLLSPAQQRELLLEFEQVEREEVGEGAHEKYVRILQSVERAVNL